MFLPQLAVKNRHMILEWGMSDKLGFVNYAGEDSRDMFIPEKEYSEETARVIDEEIRGLIDTAYNDARRLIEEHWDKVVAIAEALLKYETLSSDDIDRVMRGERLTKPTVAELLQAEAGRSRQPKPATRPDPEEDHGEAPGMMPSPA